MNFERFWWNGIRFLAPPTFIVNTSTMMIAALGDSISTMIIGCVAAGTSAYAWLYYLEERDAMPDKPVTYRNLAARLRYEIVEERALRPGSKLESIANLARRFGTTRVTVSRALNVLVREGIIEVVHGRGTYVLGTNEPAWRDDRIKDHIERALITLPSGMKAPHTRELVNEFNASYATVRRVQRTLSSRGVILRQPDGGYVRA